MLPPTPAKDDDDSSAARWYDRFKSQVIKICHAKLEQQKSTTALYIGRYKTTTFRPIMISCADVSYILLSVVGGCITYCIYIIVFPGADDMSHIPTRVTME